MLGFYICTLPLLRCTQIIQGEHRMMDRREFLTWVGVGSLATSLPIVLAACTSKTDDASSDARAESGSGGVSGEVVGTLADLDANGMVLNENAAVGPALVIRQPGSPDALVAVNPICPHAGCKVDWQADQSKYVCPCHGSQFNADGSVAQGPATKSLGTYSAKIEGDQVVVSKN
jgi:cytochrome b6-f complex iron-sulfur subunit